MNSLRVVVVGGTGNISTAIVRRLLQLGHDVTVYNRGNKPVQEHVRSLVGDRSDRDAFETLMQNEKFDAAIDMISFTEEDAASSMRAFREAGQLVHCSTVCTYGVDYDWFPTTEDHPVRPTTGYGRNKRAADNLLLGAHYKEGFPVTILKPSTTYGPKMGLLRQIAWDFGWINRIKQGMPVVICGDGNALHQFLHVEDAALAFCGVLDKSNCIGKVYNVVRNSVTTWAEHHRLAMKVIGREVPLVGIPFDDLKRKEEIIPGFGICEDIFRHHTFYSSQALQRDVPEFVPAVSLESGMVQVLEEHERLGNIPAAASTAWEDELIACQRQGFGLGTDG